MTGRHASFAMLVAGLACACAPSAPGQVGAETLESGRELLAAGKGDGDLEARLCVEHGAEPGCDLCSVAGWLGDGERCDTFCRTADEDCDRAASCFASNLPRSFATQVEAVGGLIEARADLVASSAGLCARRDYAQYPPMLQQYAELHGWGDVADFQIEAALYRIESPSGQPFWGGHNSSMGWRTHEHVAEAFHGALGPEDNGCSSFYQNGTVREALLSKRLDRLAPAAQNLSDLLIPLSSRTTSLPHRYYTRGCEVDDWSGITYGIFFVDSRPNGGPDSHGYMIVLRDWWEE